MMIYKYDIYIYIYLIFIYINIFRYQYIYITIHILQNINICDSTNNESLFSVKQFHTLKICIELITAMGIIPCLLPGVGVDMVKLCPRALTIYNEKLTDLQV